MATINTPKTADAGLERLFGPRTLIPSIRIPNAEATIRAGLNYFCGPNYAWLPAYDKVVQWCTDNHNRGMLCVGDNGTGKTLITSKILFPVLNAIGLQEKSASHNVFFGRYQAHTLGDALQKMGNMVIDDFGTEDVSNQYGVRMDYFSEIVNSAEYLGRLLICTTNLTPEKIKERYGVRTFDRLRSITVPIVFENNGVSLRK